MSDACGDNRFEIIEAYKKKLIEDTNIESRPDEMAVIDNILLRFWQMGWLPDFQDTTVGNIISRQAVLKLLSTMPPEETITKAMLIQSVKQMDTAQPKTCAYWDRESNICALHRPPARPEMSRIENALHGKSPEEQYEFIWWLLQNYAMNFTDSRQAAIEWLKGNL